MTISSYVGIAILLSALVTWIPRILPFVFVKYRKLSPLLLRFLKYLPIAIIFSLILASLVEEAPLRFRYLDGLAALLTFYVGFRSKDLLKTVLFGLVLVAVLRLFLKMV